MSPIISYPILQFADDMILTCEATWDNLWSTKTILRGFEIVYGLKVNFSKSNLFGLNLDESFLHVASAFLSCCIAKVPFKFLGIPVGANPRRCSTWFAVVEAMKKKCATWKGCHLSKGGRVTLLNSVLASMPLYFLSFYKISKKVAHLFTSIQRNFCGVVRVKLKRSIGLVGIRLVSQKKKAV